MGNSWIIGSHIESWNVLNRGETEFPWNVINPLVIMIMIGFQ